MMMLFTGFFSKKKIVRLPPSLSSPYDGDVQPNK